jgi:hypothetical protein
MSTSSLSICIGMTGFLVSACIPSEGDSPARKNMQFPGESDEMALAAERSEQWGGDIVFVRQGGQDPGSGSYRRPFNSLELVELHSDPGDVIIVLESPNCLDGGIQLQPRQSLLGGTRVECDGELCEVRAAKSKICNTDDVDPRYDGDAIRLADGATVFGIHITRATRFGIYGKNVDEIDIKNNFIEHTVATDVPERNFLECNLQVRDDFFDEGVAILKMPADELGCWIWPAAFPGAIASSDRASKLFFSNVAAAAIGLLANTGSKRARIERTVIRDFTAGLVTGNDPGPFGFAEGANGILLSTDGDARYQLDINQVNIGNSSGMTRVAECTYAAIFTQHHDTSKSKVNISNSLIREIGGCDGINSHIGVLPGVLSSDERPLQVSVQDDTIADADITTANDPDLGPKHRAELELNMNRVHVINSFNPTIVGPPDNPTGQDAANPANQFTDAFEPTMAEGAGSVFRLTVRNSTMSQNAGNGWELRFGSDSIENITTPSLANVTATLVNNCVFDNARSDDLFRSGTDQSPNFGRDTIRGRDFHQVHLFLPENPGFVIDARRNFWGQADGLLFDPDAEVTQIIAIENDTLAPGSSSSYPDRADLFTVFDASQPRRSDRGCFKLR